MAKNRAVATYLCFRLFDIGLTRRVYHVASAEIVTGDGARPLTRNTGCFRKIWQGGY
jgi:hypothetical protein